MQKPTYEEFDKFMSEMPAEVYDSGFTMVIMTNYTNKEALDAEVRETMAHITQTLDI